MIARRQNNRTKLFALSFIAITAGFVTALVFATSRNTSVITNNVKVATGGVKIIEDSDGDFGKRIISFRNEGADNAAVLLRINYYESWCKSDGTIVSGVVDGSSVVAKNWTATFVNDFVDGGDGWYYYKKILAPNAEVQVLTSITLTDDNFLKYNYDFGFHFESVQADAAAVETLWGKDVTITNGVVAWAF